MKRKELPRKKGRLFLAIASVLIVIAIMIITSVGASLGGVELHKVETEIVQVEEVNRRLEDEVVMGLSLTEVSEAVKEKFVKPETIVYLNKTIPVLGYAN